MSTLTAPTLLPMGITNAGDPAHLNLGDRGSAARHGLIIGGTASGKTVLLHHLAHHAAATMPQSSASHLAPQPLATVATPTNGLVLLDDPLAFAPPAALHELLDRADAHHAAVVATACSEQNGLAEQLQHRLSSAGRIWLHHPNPWRVQHAPVDVTSLDKHGHGYLHTARQLREFRFGLHSTHA